MSTLHEEPPMRYICEAREAGKPSFEFPTLDGDTARAVCDASGWELIRVYEKGKDSDRKPQHAAKGDPALSKKQMTTLVIEAQKTHRMLSRMSLVTDTFEDWRHAEVYKCVRREGLSKCQNVHYKKLLIHFRSLRGETTVGADSAGKKWSREGGDTEERRTQLVHQIAHELGSHARRVDKPQSAAEQRLADHAISKGGAIGISYLMAIAKAKNPGQTLHDEGCLIKLPASRLEQLLYTLRNRISAREGRGETKNRNKDQ